MRYIDYLIKLIKSLFGIVTIRQSSVVLSGSIINGILGACFYIVLARFLGPADFGIFVITVSLLTLIADIADLGTNTGLVRFVSANFSFHKEKALQYLKLSLEIKLVVWLLVLFAGILIIPFIARELFNKKELINPLQLSMVGVGGAMLFSYATSSFQAFSRFFAWSVVNIISNLLRLILIIILSFSQLLNLNTGLITYITLPFLGFFLALLLLPTRSIFKVSGEMILIKQLVSYNRWVAFSTIFAAISSRLDTFLSARLLTTAEVGIYGAANQLILFVPQLISALGIVAAPKFAGFINNEQMLIYLKKLQIMVLFFTIIGLITIPIFICIIPVFFGQEYKAAIAPFTILFIAMLIFLVSVPLQTSILYYFSRPKFFAYLSFFNLLIIGILGYILILNYHIIGAALTVLIGMIFNFLVTVIWFLKMTSDNRNNSYEKK